MAKKNREGKGVSDRNLLLVVEVSVGLGKKVREHRTNTSKGKRWSVHILAGFQGEVSRGLGVGAGASGQYLGGA